MHSGRSARRQKPTTGIVGCCARPPRLGRAQQTSATEQVDEVPPPHVRVQRCRSADHSTSKRPPSEPLCRIFSLPAEPSAGPWGRPNRSESPAESPSGARVYQIAPPEAEPLVSAIPQTAASADCGPLAVRDACHSQSSASGGCHNRRLSPPRATLPPIGAGIGSDQIPGPYPQREPPAFRHRAPTRSLSPDDRLLDNRT